MSVFELVARGLAATVLAGGVAAAALIAASRLVPTRHLSVRLAAAALLAAGFATGAFWVLSPWRLFRLGPALGLALAAAAATAVIAGRGGRRTLPATGRRLARSVAGLRAFPDGALFALLAGLPLVRVLRVAAEPPLGWDGLTYHLYKAGRLVQDGGLVPQAAPDAWGICEALAPGGEILWSWAMLPLRGDALVPWAETAAWAAGALAVYAGARELGAGRRRAALAAAALAVLPSSLAPVGSGYVDGAVAAALLLASVFVLRCLRRRRPRPAEAVLAAAGLGIAAGIKLTALPLVAIGGLALAVALIRRATLRRGAVVLACAAALALGVPPYLQAAAEWGSPFYPVALSVAGHQLLPGRGVIETSARRPEVAAGPDELAAWMLWRRRRDGAFVDPGLGAAALGALAALALPGLLRDRRRRAGSLYLCGAFAASIALAVAPPMREILTTAAVSTSGRYFLAGLGALAILAAAGRGVWVGPGLVAAVAVAEWQGRPVAWDGDEAAPLLALFAALAVAALAAAALTRVLARVRVRGPRQKGVATAILASLALLAVGAATVAGAAAIRQRHRDRLWAAASRAHGPLFHFHRLHPTYAAAWTLWRDLDGQRPRVLAVVAGWDGLGHHRYLYPLLGSRLQNRVLSVSAAVDGRPIDAADTAALAAETSFPRWLARLVAQRVDAVVSLAPRWSLEDGWMRARPDVFTPCGESRGRLHAVFCLDRAAAAAALGAGRGGGSDLVSRPRNR